MSKPRNKIAFKRNSKNTGYAPRAAEQTIKKKNFCFRISIEDFCVVYTFPSLNSNNGWQTLLKLF